jgi:transposase
VRRFIIRGTRVLLELGAEVGGEIAQRPNLTRATVGRWRKRFREQRINGLYDELRPGKRARSMARAGDHACEGQQSHCRS